MRIAYEALESSLIYKLVVAHIRTN